MQLIAQNLGRRFSNLISIFCVGAVLVSVLIYCIHSFLDEKQQDIFTQQLNLSSLLADLNTSDDRLSYIIHYMVKDQHASLVERYVKLSQDFDQTLYAVNEYLPQHLHASYQNLIYDLVKPMRRYEKLIAIQLKKGAFDKAKMLYSTISHYRENGRINTNLEIFNEELSLALEKQKSYYEFLESALTFGLSITLLLALLFFSKMRLKALIGHFNALEEEHNTLEEQHKEEMRARVKAEEIIDEAFEALSDGFAIYDQNDCLVRFNSAYANLYKRSRLALKKGTSFEAILKYGIEQGQYPEAGQTPEEQNEWLEKRLQQHREPNHDILQKTADGKWLMIRERITPSGYVVGIRNDITQLKNVEAELGEQKRRADMLAEVAAKTQNLAIVFDASGHPIWVNESFLNVTEFELDDIFHCEPGSLFCIDYDVENDDPEVIQAFEKKQSFKGEVKLYTLSGDFIWVDIDVQPVVDHEGRVYRFIAVMSDITERRGNIISLKRYAEDLKRYAHIASHDLQEPLRKIDTFVGMLHLAIEENNKEDIRHSMNVITGAVRRGRNLVTDLLRYSKMRDRALEKEPFNLKEMVDDIVEQLCDGTKDDLMSVVSSVPEWNVLGDAPLINQVLVNLIGNALKYSKKDMRTEVDISVHPYAHNGMHGLHISDKGIGFDMKFEEIIFEPFKRLVSKDDYDGTGIGLSLVHSILEKHGWGIKAEGVPGGGCTFIIMIPDCDVSNVMDIMLKVQEIKRETAFST